MILTITEVPSCYAKYGNMCCEDAGLGSNATDGDEKHAGYMKKNVDGILSSPVLFVLYETLLQKSYLIIQQRNIISVMD